MSVLIRGMDMPKYGCDHCFLRTGNYCGRIEKDESVVEYARKNERHPDCPLVPVPPHGRLIDADALKVSLAFAEKTAEWAVPALRAVLMVIDEMPTIIGAEEDE